MRIFKILILLTIVPVGFSFASGAGACFQGNSNETATGLKGTRKLQSPPVQENTFASSQGAFTTGAAVTTGQVGSLAFGTPQNLTAGPIQGADGPNQNALPAGTGKSFGEGSAVGSGSGFVLSGFGTSFAAGTSGGNSTSSSDPTKVPTNDPSRAPTKNPTISSQPSIFCVAAGSKCTINDTCCGNGANVCIGVCSRAIKAVVKDSDKNIYKLSEGRIRGSGGVRRKLLKGSGTKSH
jgi:hypothetical protein